ncbi:MAG TPA: MFS transporter [Candidatus Limnocylindrales bacterium]
MTQPAELPAAEIRGALTRSAAVYMILFSAVGCWSAYASVLFKELGVGLAVIGLLASVPAAVSIVGAPTWGLVADRLGDVRPPLLVAGLWAAAAASLLALQPPMPWTALVVAVLAAGSSGLTPLVDARTVERLGRARDRFGQARAFGSLGFILTTLAVGMLVQASGTVAMLAVYVPALALTGIAGAALLGRGSRSTRASGIGPIRALRLLRDPGMGLFFAGSVVVWIAATGVMAFFSLRLIELGGDARLVGIGWAANAVLEIPTMLAYRRLVGRLRVQWLLVAGAAIFVVRAALFAVTGSAIGLVVGAALGGVGFGLFLVGTTTFVARRAPASLRATAQALFSSTAFAIGSIVGGILAGLVAGEWGLAAVFPAAAVTSAVGALMIWLAVIRRDVPVQAAEVAPRATPTTAVELPSPDR